VLWSPCTYRNHSPLFLPFLLYIFFWYPYIIRHSGKQPVLVGQSVNRRGVKNHFLVQEGKTTLPTRQLLWKIWKDSRPGDKPLYKLVGTEGVAGICGSNQLHPTLHLLSFKRTWPLTVLLSLYFIIPKRNLFWKPRRLKHSNCHNYAGLSYVSAQN